MSKSWLACADERVATCLFIALCGLCGLPLYAETQSPDPLPVLGKNLARIECSQCHVVSPDQEFPPSLDVSAPSFEVIANRPATSERSLRHFISTTHWDGQTIPIKMPAPGLTKQETTAVVAYIMSLRKGR